MERNRQNRKDVNINKWWRNKKRTDWRIHSIKNKNDRKDRLRN